MDDVADSVPTLSGKAGPSVVALRLLGAGVALAELPDRLAAAESREAIGVGPVLLAVRAAVADADLEPPIVAQVGQRLGSMRASAALTQPNASMSVKHAQAMAEAAPRSISRQGLEEIRAQAVSLLDHLGHATGPDRGWRANEQERFVLQCAAVLVRSNERARTIRALDASQAPLHGEVHGPDRDRLDDYVLFKDLRSLDHLVSRWARLARALEDHPEKLVMEEYENWMVSRDTIQGALSMLSEKPHRRAVTEALDPLDEAFRRSTREVPESAHQDDGWTPRGWWWYRVPRETGAFFERTLAARDRGRC